MSSEIKPRSRGGGPKFTPSEREAVLNEVARLDRWGYSQEQIGKKLAEAGFATVTGGMVCNYLKEIRERYRNAAMVERHEAVLEKLALLREIRREALEAWERSKEDARRRVEKKVPPLSIDTSDLGKDAEAKRGKTKGKKGKKPKLVQRPVSPEEEREMLISEIVDTIEGRLPANQYLATVLDTIKSERELLGLDMPTKSTIMGTIGVGVGPLPEDFWDRLAGVQPKKEDPIEATIQRAKESLANKPNGAE